MAHAIVMPSYGMYTAEGTLARWLKPSGAAVEAGEVIAEIDVEKAIAEVMAPVSGVLHHVVAEGGHLEVDSLMGYLLAPGEVPPDTHPAPVESPAAPVPAPPPVAPARSPVSPDQEVFAIASPNARRVAAELGVDLAHVVGTGPGGRITEDDVRTAVSP